MHRPHCPKRRTFSALLLPSAAPAVLPKIILLWALQRSRNDNGSVWRIAPCAFRPIKTKGERHEGRNYFHWVRPHFGDDDL